MTKHVIFVLWNINSRAPAFWKIREVPCETSIKNVSNSGRKPRHILAIKAIFSHESLGQMALMNIPCHTELCELGHTLS